HASIITRQLSLFTPRRPPKSTLLPYTTLFRSGNTPYIVRVALLTNQSLDNILRNDYIHINTHGGIEKFKHDKGESFRMNMKMLYTFPQRRLMISVPVTLVIGFIGGALVDRSFLQRTILFGTIVMIYATMVGFQFKELSSLKGTKVLVLSIIINFAIIPFVAYLLG